MLHAALEETGRAGIGRFSFHNREYLAAVRALDGVLALHTMRFHDEIVSADELEVDAPGKGPSKREVDMAGELVESLHTRFDPKDYKDTYRDAVLTLIASKAQGVDIEIAEPEPDADSSDLLAALQASLKKKG